MPNFFNDTKNMEIATYLKNTLRIGNGIIFWHQFFLFPNIIIASFFYDYDQLFVCQCLSQHRKLSHYLDRWVHSLVMIKVQMIGICKDKYYSLQIFSLSATLDRSWNASNADILFFTLCATREYIKCVWEHTIFLLQTCARSEKNMKGKSFKVNNSSVHRSWFYGVFCKLPKIL